MSTQPHTHQHDERAPLDRRAVVAREHERFGGTKPGAAFFGWLSALGLSVILSTFLVAVGVSIDLVPDDADSSALGWDGVLLVVAVVLVSFSAGGYVAGRMARFDGVRQGLAVFAWTVVMSVVLAILGAVAGARFNLLAQVDGFPSVPDDLGALTLTAFVALVGVVLAAAVGAVAGGASHVAGAAPWPPPPRPSWPHPPSR